MFDTIIPILIALIALIKKFSEPKNEIPKITDPYSSSSAMEQKGPVKRSEISRTILLPSTRRK